jgi:Mg2+ and Co2+ transporter CorA
MASMPHYMASSINDLTATSIEKAVTGLMTMLELVATAVEEIVLFVIHMMKSTYLCLIKLAVHGSMKAVTTFDSTASSSLQNTIFALRDSLTDTSETLSTLSESIDTVKDKTNHVPGVHNPKLPTVDLTNQIKRFKSINACI